MELSDLKIIVTGAARGMGAHFVGELVKAGASVAAGDVDEAALAELPAGVHRRGLDVGDAASQNRYLNDGNIRALAANVPLVPTGFSHTGGSLTVKWNSGGGTPTTGALRVVIHYAQLGNATTTYEV